MDQLNIPLADITPQGLSLACAPTAEDLGLDEADAKLVGPLSVTLDVGYDAANVSVSGNVDGTILRQCVRCLREFEDPLSLPLYAEFIRQVDPRGKAASGVPRGERETRPSDADAEGSESDEEDEVYYYQGDHVNLAPMLREQIILAVPIRPLCSEQCAGLCPSCGQNLNERLCACVPDPVNNPFRVLRERYEKDKGKARS